MANQTKKTIEKTTYEELKPLPPSTPPPAHLLAENMANNGTMTSQQLFNWHFASMVAFMREGCKLAPDAWLSDDKFVAEPVQNWENSPVKWTAAKSASPAWFEG